MARSEFTTKIYIYISINDERDRRERNRERIKSISNGTTFVALLKFSGSKKTPFRFGHRFSLDDEVHLPPSLRGWTRQARVKHHGLSTKIPLLFPYEIHLSLCAYNCIARFHMILNHPRLARVVAYVEKSFQILSCEINILVKTEKNFDKLFFFYQEYFWEKLSISLRCTHRKAIDSVSILPSWNILHWISKASPVHAFYNGHNELGGGREQGTRIRDERK